MREMGKKEEEEEFPWEKGGKKREKYMWVRGGRRKNISERWEKASEWRRCEGPDHEASSSRRLTDASSSFLHLDGECSASTCCMMLPSVGAQDVGLCCEVKVGP